MTEHTITIITRTKFKPLRAAYAVSLQLLVVGVGIWTDSPAMQWVGAGFLLILLLAMVAVSRPHEGKGLTIEEARARLDQIEADQ